MPDAVVRHRNGGGDTEWKTLDLTINGPGANFQIATERIAAAVHLALDDLHLDLLDIAAAVFAADRVVRRGGDTRPKLGEHWRRELQFEIKVRCPDLWSQPEMAGDLCDIVSFLTGDDVGFRFAGGRRRLAQQDYLPIDRVAERNSCTPKVILFSGGLDSLAGAIETLEREDGPVLLVTHRSAQKMIPHQDRLADALIKRYPGRITYVPIRATFIQRASPESTQRSRSFLFAAFGFVLARMASSNDLTFFENGVVSHNLPINRQVVGTMATRTTHPLVLHRMEAFLSRLSGHKFSIANPYAWRTKKEVVEVLRDHDAQHLIADTVSCNQVRDRSISKTHCGTCSQCLDRRFALLAAGLADADPEDAYEIAMLTGDRSGDRKRTLALDWPAHAGRLAGENIDRFAERFMGELVRIAEGFPRLQPDDVIHRCHALQQRHGVAVKSVLEQALRDHATAILEQTLPETSLLRAFVADRSRSIEMPELEQPVTRIEPDHTAATEDEEAGPLWPLRVRMYNENGVPVIDVKGLGTVRRAPASAAHALRPQHEQDRDAGLGLDDHRYVAAGILSPAAGSSKEAVAQNVRRCRHELAKCYKVVEDCWPEHDILIQSRRPYGYRLDPTIKLLPSDP